MKRKVISRHHLIAGFTLTEMAIVLGVVGTILASIWTAAAQVSNNQKIATGATEVLTIASNIRAFYSGRGGIAPSLQGTEITPMLEKANVFPSNMPLATVTDPNWGAQIRPFHPWGSYASVYASSNGSSSSFRISFYNLTVSQCANLVAKTVIPSASGGGPIGVGSWYTTPVGQPGAGAGYGSSNYQDLTNLPAGTTFTVANALTLCGGNSTSNSQSAEFDFSL
jgi:type II secretory pathway pseudopilin PulG